MFKIFNLSSLNLPSLIEIKSFFTILKYPSNVFILVLGIAHTNFPDLSFRTVIAPQFLLSEHQLIEFSNY